QRRSARRMTVPSWLWPRRMTQQLALLLLIALLASNAIAMLYLQRTGALIHPLSRTLAVERLITAYHATQGLSAEDASRLLAAMQTPDSELWVSAWPIANTLDMRAEEYRLVADLSHRLKLPAETTIGMQLERISGGPAREHVFVAAGWAPLRLRTSIDLLNGSFLNGIQHPAGGYEWGRMLAYTLPVTTIPVLLIVVFFMRR
ncbi:sensor histidine kinase, partial [Pseudomonas syringae pv. actinidiae ICMP 19101]